MKRNIGFYIPTMVAKFVEVSVIVISVMGKVVEYDGICGGIMKGPICKGMAVVEVATNPVRYGDPNKDANNWGGCSQSRFKYVFLPEKIV